MESDWSVACGAGDPSVVVPWGGEVCDAATGRPIQYIDLRSAPEAVQQIPEAAKYPCIAAALRRWNQPDTSLFTAKCDVWGYPAKLFDGEDLAEFDFARGSYIDLLPTDPAIFSSFAACEKQLRVWTEIARSIDLPACRSEWILRPARIFSALPPRTLATPSLQNGFATTLYTWGYGDSPQSASIAWDAALQAFIEPLSTFIRS